MLQGFERLLGCAGKEGDGRRQLEAWQLAARQGVVNLFHKRDRSEMKGRKVTGGGSQGAKEGSRSSGHHAAKTKATKSQRESKQSKRFWWEGVLVQT